MLFLFFGPNADSVFLTAPHDVEELSRAANATQPQTRVETLSLATIMDVQEHLTRIRTRPSAGAISLAATVCQLPTPAVLPSHAMPTAVQEPSIRTQALQNVELILPGVHVCRSQAPAGTPRLAISMVVTEPTMLIPIKPAVRAITKVALATQIPTLVVQLKVAAQVAAEGLWIILRRKLLHASRTTKAARVSHPDQHR